MVKKFISYYKNHKKVFFLDMISAFIMSGIDLLYPIALRAMLNDYIPDGNMKYILYLGLALFAIYLIRARLSFYVTYNGHMMGVFIERDMRHDLFEKYEELDYDFYDDHQTGVLMSYITNHLHDISEMAHHVPEDMFISGIMFIGSFVFLATISLPLTIIIFSFVIIIVWFSWWRRKKMLAAQRKVRKSHGELNSKIENSLSGIRLTKAYNNEDYELDQFTDVNHHYANSRRLSYFQMGIFHVGNQFFLNMLNLLLLVVGGLFVFYDYIDYVDLFTYYLYISFLTRPINRLIAMIEQIQNGVSGFEKFYQVIQLDKKIKPLEPIKALENPKGEIVFKDVDFNYGKDAHQVLIKFNLNIKPGEKIGLIGETGVGKSTISKLVPRFYDPIGGEIMIDGVDIKHYDVSSLRKAIGHVQQDVFIFYGTIKENILYGNLKASDEEVIEAAKKARVHDYIMTLENGYDTIAGEKGVKLSGGQKQRIAIARLFLKKPKIIILDEATSALDNVTERLIQEAFEDLIHDKTAIIIAHRLSTVKDVDRIIVLGNEGIEEMGTHDQLMKEKGIYYHLINE
jgi:ATP-binding cassette subfamily B protein